MSRERRAERRVRTRLQGWWGSGELSHPCVIRDLSMRGCFVMAAEGPAAGQVARIEVGVPGVAHMQARGSVVRSVEGEGFAVKFVRLNAAERTVLSMLLEHLTKRGGE